MSWTLPSQKWWRTHEEIASGLITTRDHRRQDGVVRAARGAQAVRVPLLEYEVAASVLEREAAPLGHRVRPKVCVDALDVAGRISFGIGDREQNGVGGRVGKTVGDAGVRRRGREEGGAFLQVVLQRGGQVALL
jgi:hypothetical protein